MKKSKQVIRVNLNGEIIYMTPEAYTEFSLQLSTGDYHTHTVRRLKKLPKSVPTYMVRDAVYYNPRLKYPTVESIIEAYRNEDEVAESYSKSEESSLAEFVSSFCYGELSLSQIIENARLENETILLLKSFENHFGIKALYEVITSVSELTLGDIYYQNGEICSAIIGEQEHQVDDTLAKAYQTLTPEEKERVMRESGAGIFTSSRQDGRFIYTSDNYSRWILLADEDALARKLKKALKNASKLSNVGA